MRPERDARIAVAVHGIEPASFERCALIRDWLDDHGVDRVTLLVIPARDLHPVGGRSPEMVRWLEERRCAGDSIAQHGFQHVHRGARGLGDRLNRLAPVRRTGEFSSLDDAETRRAVHAGWRVMKLAGVEPDGFVAPAYAYTSALRRALGARFHWWADLLHVHSTAPAEDATPLCPALSLGAAGLFSRAFSPPLVRVGSLLPTTLLRVDLHPGDLDHPRRMMALEWVLGRHGQRRTAVTYRELAGA